MKIIKKGNILPKNKLPWAGKQFTCKNCSTIIELESCDWLFGNLDRSADYTCPVCYSLIKIIESR